MPALTIDGDAGPLEAQLDSPTRPPRAAVLLCHPHPPSGGTMNTHAVFRAMRALRGLGCEVLRFNFRGVGQSAGQIGDGEGELADGRAAFLALTRLRPGLPTLAGGFSFGAWVGMSVGAKAGASALLGLGAPYQRYDFACVTRVPIPKAFVLARDDQFTPVDTMQRVLTLKDLRGPTRLWVIERTSHLFTEDLDAYEAGVTEAGHWLLEQLGILGA